MWFVKRVIDYLRLSGLTSFETLGVLRMADLLAPVQGAGTSETDPHACNLRAFEGSSSVPDVGKAAIIDWCLTNAASGAPIKSQLNVGRLRDQPPASSGGG